MNNAEKFKQIFGLYATEVWSMPESDFLKWLSRTAETVSKPRRTGRWLINSDGYYPYCSECLKESPNGDMTDYCPYCHADMRCEEGD